MIIATTQPLLIIDTIAPTTSEPNSDTTTVKSVSTPIDTMFDPSTPTGVVEQVALADLAAFVVCLEQLPNCDVEAVVRHSALEYADGTVDLVTDWNEAGYEARQTDDYNYRVDGIAEFSEDGTEAVVLLCLWGGTQLYAPATETSPETVIDGDYESSRERVLVRRLGDRWLVTALDFDEETVGEANNLCL